RTVPRVVAQTRPDPPLAGQDGSGVRSVRPREPETRCRQPDSPGTGARERHLEPGLTSSFTYHRAPPPASRRPGRRRPPPRGAGLPRGDKVERPTGRPPLAPRGRSARLRLGR